MSTAFIGQAVSRVDGHAKVTGRATYAAEFQVANVAHADVVRSTVALRRRDVRLDALEGRVDAIEKRNA